MIIACTGHRPPKLGGYDWRKADKLVSLAGGYLDIKKPEKVISGMALGWDMAVARAALLSGRPLIAAIPFSGQEKLWPKKDRDTYADILSMAEQVTIVSPGGYAGWKMQKRNEWMVDNADLIMALWDGSSGGTANCIEYAGSRTPPVPCDNLWERWVNGSRRISQHT